jgi:uncharacterized protein (TIGR02268 family)
MRKFLSESVLLVALVASIALPGDRDKLAVRTLLLSEHPDEATHRVWVQGQVVTVLRFEQPCDPTRTRMLGGEGRFEPLGVVGRKVVLEPLRNLAPDEAVPLLVTLADGTEVPFLLRPSAPDEGRWTDQQVNVFKNRESYKAMSSALNDALKKQRVLEEQVERYRKEETSEDHALAALLASGAEKQTPFKIEDRFSGKDADAEVDAVLFRGQGKAAVVLKIKNLDPNQPWSMKEARLVTMASGRDRAFAVRTTVPSILPGASGVVAFVADKSAFLENGQMTNLFLEVYRHDGLRQSIVQVDHRLAGK